MKLPSTWTRLLCALNKAWLNKALSNRGAFALAAFVLVMLSAFFLGGALLKVYDPSAEAALGSATVPGAPVVDDEDVITLLGLNLGGHDLAIAAWSNMNLSEKQSLRDQTVRIARMAQGAELDGLPSSSEVARALRWGISSFLADAWEKKIASETDLSEAAARSFYEANRARYMGSGMVRYRKAVYPASRKAAAQRAKDDLKQAPLSRLRNCVTVDWTEYDSVAEPLGGALRGAPAGSVMGPLETSEGYVLYEVIERREEAQQSFEDCRDRVKDDMVRLAVMERLERLTSN